MRFAPAVLAVVAALVLYAGLDDTGLFDEREARDAQVAQELIRAREALTPVYGREARFEKPILAYAPEVAVRLWADPPDVRSRQLRATLALVLLLLTASIGARHFGARAGWAAALVLASSLALPVAARTDATQLLATLLAWVACSSFADAVLGHVAGRGLRLTVGWGALAAAFVTAGPLPALWPLGGLALFMALTRSEGGWKRVQPLAGLVLVVGLALPWYGAMSERYGIAFLEHAPFFPYATEPRVPWFKGILFTLSFLAVGFFPWSSLLPGALLHAATWWRPRRPPGAVSTERTWTDPESRERREETAAHFFVACLIAGLIPIAIYPTPPLPAILPALPAAALLCGRLIDHLFENPERLARPLARATLLLALFGTSGALLLAVLATRIHGPTQEVRQLATVLFVTAWLPFLASFAGRRRAAVVLLALPVAVGTPLAALRLLPAMEEALGTRAIAEAMAGTSPARAPLVLVDPPPPSLRLYGTRNLVIETPASVVQDRNRAADGLVYVAFRPSREAEVARSARAPLEILLRTPALVLARIHREQS